MFSRIVGVFVADANGSASSGFLPLEVHRRSVVEKRRVAGIVDQLGARELRPEVHVDKVAWNLVYLEYCLQEIWGRRVNLAERMAVVWSIFACTRLVHLCEWIRTARDDPDR